jgi:protein-disulfide isomerase
MTSRHRGKRLSSEGGAPPAGKTSPKKQRQTDREASRALAPAGTRGSSGGDPGSLLLVSLAFIAIAIVVAAVTVFVSRSGGGSPGAIAAPSVVTPSNVTSSGRTLGNSAAPVTVDIYGDFRCSACYRFTTDGTEKDLVTNYVATGKAKLVWHDLLSIDKLRGGTASLDAANAAWCAADQGKFWVMHDWLYGNDDAPNEDPAAFTASRLSQIGKAAGLDMSKLQPCLDAGTHDAAIAAEAGTTPADASGTPSLFVNGQFVGDPNANLVPTYAQIAAAIDAARVTPSPSPKPS